MSHINQLISKLEASNQTREWVVPDKDGILPVNFNPDKDNILHATICGSQREDHLNYWKGKPYKSVRTQTVTIGGEQPND